MTAHKKSHTDTDHSDGANIKNALVDAKGDLIIATANDTPARHAAGNDGEVPIWDSSATDGVANAVLSEAKALHNLLGWAYDLLTATSGTALSGAAVLTMVKIPLRRQISLSNVWAYQTAVGVSLTHAYGLAYKSDGTVIGQSADQSATWVGGTGVRSIALTGAPFTVTPLQANDWVWGALYCGTAGTIPQFARVGSFNPIVNLNLAAATARFATQAIADTATPGNITPSGLTLGSISFWMGLS